MTETFTRHVFLSLLCVLCVLNMTKFIWAGETSTEVSTSENRQEERSSSQDKIVSEPASENSQPPHDEQSPTSTEERKRSEQEKQDFFSRLRNQIYKSVSSSARWFDSFFGDTKSYYETDRSHGKVESQLFWDEKDGFESSLLFKAKFYLPELERRWNLFLGRTNQEDFLTESNESLERVSQQARSSEGEEDWLLGLGFRPLHNDRNRLDFQAGVNMKVMPEAFGKIRYRANVFLGGRKENLFRFRETVFWEQEDGFGSSTKIDFDRLFGQHFLLRWANSGKISESSEGVEWWTGLILYQNLSTLRALSYESWIKGATEAPVDVKEYGVQVIYRQNLESDWLFGEFRTDVTWPKDEPEETREIAWGFGIGLELHFGEKN